MSQLLSFPSETVLSFLDERYPKSFSVHLTMCTYVKFYDKKINEQTLYRIDNIEVILK